MCLLIQHSNVPDINFYGLCGVCVLVMKNRVTFTTDRDYVLRVWIVFNTRAIYRTD